MSDLPSYPDDAVERLARDLAALRPDPPDARAITMPSADQLRHLLRTCLYASIGREEGRRVRFRLLVNPLCTPDGRPIFANGEASDFVRAALPGPMTIEALVKLAPAADPATACIVVGSNLSLRGIVRQPRGRNEYFYRVLSGLEIRVIAPGHLSVVVPGGRTVFVFQSGNASFPREWKTLRRIADTVTECLALVEPDSFLNTAQRVIDAARAHGHGGALFVIRQGQQVRKVTYRYGESATDFLANRAALAAHVDPAFERADVLEIQDLRDYASACELVGGLTAVDGAVLLTSDLHLLGFGVFADGDAAAPVEVCNAETGNSDAPTTAAVAFHGTRHRSAAGFAWAQEKGAVAFVVSQDGPLTVMARRPDDSSVVVFRNVEL